MKPTRGDNSPAWCSTFATIRRGWVQPARLIGEAPVPDKRLATGPARRSKQEVGNLPLESLVGRHANRVLDATFLQRACLYPSLYRFELCVQSSHCGQVVESTALRCRVGHRR